ncbi:DUF4258 domain-containing protein [candidate division KSB1 bacterium]|nr:DUF4258 domain-containing protein [candidate division KSB1 bacterium]
MAKRKLPRNWPEWWDWEIKISQHIELRMGDRAFTEIDLRTMLTRATNYYPDDVAGRWVIETKHFRKEWEVIVEPDFDNQLLVLVTAYKVLGE